MEEERWTGAVACHPPGAFLLSSGSAGDIKWVFSLGFLFLSLGVSRIPIVESSVSSLPFIPLLGRNLSGCQEGLKLSEKVLKGICVAYLPVTLALISLGNGGGNMLSDA